jgi:hypothetical protein
MERGGGEDNKYYELFRKYLHDIRNMKTLDKEMLNNIRSMTNEEKMYIIIALNDVLENMNTLLD